MEEALVDNFTQALIVAAIPNIAGWLIIAFANDAVLLYVGRSLIGFGVGVISFIVPVYIAEATPKQLQGFLGALNWVLFLHRYSGDMTLRAALLISVTHFFQTVNLFYAQQMSEGLQLEIGIGGNFYHHYLLSRLRKDGKRGYVFPVEVCLIWWSAHIIYLRLSIGWDWPSSLSLSTAGFLCWTVLYLAGRSLATRQWYLHKMDNFAKQRKALFPFIF